MLELSKYYVVALTFFQITKRFSLRNKNLSPFQIPPPPTDYIATNTKCIDYNFTGLGFLGGKSIQVQRGGGEY